MQEVLIKDLMIYDLRFKNIIKTVLTVLFLDFVFLTLNLSEVNAQTPSDWQTRAQGLSISQNSEKKTGGLGFVIKTVDNNSNASWPFLSLHGGITSTSPSDAWGPQYIDLGLIKPLTGTATAPVETVDWVHNQLNFNSGALQVTSSRLTPALLVQNNANAIRLFAGNVAHNIMQPSPWTPHPLVITRSAAAPSSPKYLAYSSGGTIMVQAIPASGTTALSLPPLDNNWILVWYGNNTHFAETKRPISYPFPISYTADAWGYGSVPNTEGYNADAPILLKFNNSPTSIIQSSEGGIDLAFGTTGNNFTVMPLLGREHFKASDTESWGTGGALPSNILTKINFWANRLCSYPTIVSETYAYDGNSDTSTITENFTFTPVCSGSTTFAPLPPFLSLAKDKLPITFSGNLVDGNLFTEFGPILGIENINSYTWSISGFKKYTDNKRVTTNISTAPIDLRQDLTNQVDKLVAAGHMAPWITADRANIMGFSGGIFFSNEADILYHLAEIVPILPEPQKTNLINYLKSERTNYPPETTVNLTLGQGTLRQGYNLENPPYPAGYQSDLYNVLRTNSMTKDVFFLSRVPLYNLFGLSRYYELIDDPVASSSATWQTAKSVLNQEMSEQDWATNYWFAQVPDKKVAVENINRFYAGITGFIKLAKLTGDSQEESLGRSLLVKAAVSRIAMAVYPRYLYSPNVNLVELPANANWQPQYSNSRYPGYLYNYSWTGGNDDARQVAKLNQFGLYLYDNAAFWEPNANVYSISPNYLSAYKDMVPELARFLADFDKSDVVIDLDKVKTLLPQWYASYMESTWGGEHSILDPIDPFQLFMATAWLEGETPQNLARFASFPWIDTGDLFYVQKLAETVKAYEGVAWEDQTYLAGDINQDHTVNLDDIRIFFDNWNMPRDRRSDVNGDGIVNSVDFALILNDWGKVK